jgi:hypothetical protein
VENSAHSVTRTSSSWYDDRHFIPVFGSDDCHGPTQLIGNLGDDPELRYAPNGTTRTTFRVAVNDRWTGADGQAREHVEWYRCVCFGRL